MVGLVAELGGRERKWQSSFLSLSLMSAISLDIIAAG